MTDADDVCPLTPIGTPPSSERGEEPAPPPPDSAESSPRLHPSGGKRFWISTDTDESLNSYPNSLGLVIFTE